jgi:hypothetical protein
MSRFRLKHPQYLLLEQHTSISAVVNVFLTSHVSTVPEAAHIKVRTYGSILKRSAVKIPEPPEHTIAILLPVMAIGVTSTV